MDVKAKAAFLVVLMSLPLVVGSAGAVSARSHVVEYSCGLLGLRAKGAPTLDVLEAICSHVGAELFVF